MTDPIANTAPREAAIGQAEVEHVAALASLALTPEEMASLGKDLRSILGYVDELRELDTTGVAPLTHVSELFSTAPPQPAATAHLRADEPRSSLDRSLVMHGAPATDGTFFKVPKVIER